MTMRGITLITADGVRHNILVALAGSGISISRDSEGRMVLDTTGGGGGGVTTLAALTDVDLTGLAVGDHLEWDGTDWVAVTPAPGGGSSDPVVLADATTDPTATAGQASIYGAERANGQVIPWVMPNIGFPFPLQPALWQKQVAYLEFASGTDVAFGMSADTKMGTVTYNTGGPSETALSSTSLHASLSKLILNTPVTANACNGIRGAEAVYWRGNATRRGGFYMAMRWAGRFLPTSRRILIGASNYNSDIASDPSGLAADIMAFGQDGADTSLQFITKATAGAATKTSLGFSLSTSVVYDAEILVPPNGSTVYYRWTNVDTGAVSAEGSADISGLSATIFHRMWCAIGSVAAENIAMGIHRIYTERFF